MPENLKKLIVNNLGLKTGALVLAVLVWGIISGRERTFSEKTLKIPVEVFNVSDNAEVVSLRPDDPQARLELAQALLGFDHQHLWVVLAGMTLFFAGFNYLEARLPAQLTLAAPGHERGAALGIFATAQFFGSFLGGALGGVLLGRFGLAGVFWGSAAVALGWAAVAAGTRRAAANRHEHG